MLGLRRYKETQIDIWQGDYLKFAVDFSLPVDTQSDASDTTNQAPDFFLLGLANLKPLAGQRFHVSHLVTHVKDAAGLMAATRTFLDQTASQPKLRRITFIAPNTPIYDSLQEALFSTFEDETDVLGR